MANDERTIEMWMEKKKGASTEKQKIHESIELRSIRRTNNGLERYTDMDTCNIVSLSLCLWLCFTGCSLCLRVCVCVRMRSYIVFSYYFIRFGFWSRPINYSWTESELFWSLLFSSYFPFVSSSSLLVFLFHNPPPSHSSSLRILRDWRSTDFLLLYSTLRAITLCACVCLRLLFFRCLFVVASIRMEDAAGEESRMPSDAWRLKLWR